jgi:hypothetical protein
VEDIEKMHSPEIEKTLEIRGLFIGITHFTISRGSKETVNLLTDRLREDRYIIQGGHKTSGNGYYENIILDSKGNFIELPA